MEFLRLLESIRTPLGDAFFMFCTYGGEEVMLLGLICLIYWCINKKLAYRMTFAYLPSGLAVEVTKLTCRVERPWVQDPTFTIVEKARKSATGYSFPSGHTQNATALFTTLGHVNKKLPIKLLFFLVIPLVMFSRMYLGVHTPADVLVSVVMSLIIVIGINVLADRIELNHKKRLIIMAILLTIAFATAIYTYVLFASGTIAYKDAADSFKGCGGGVGFLICWVIETKYIDFDVRCDAIWKQVLKCVIGFAIVLLLKEGIKYGFHALFCENLFCEFFRYLILMFWAMMGMPLVIKKFFQAKA
ncbi:MAG: phosphatase PAP2 family protein [Lachnospiraceae bacterium]|nr:phosphatase PAP2 family protein [Lachnospiraceae bacterium]